MVQLPFDAAGREPLGGAVENWPDGWHLAVITGSDSKATKAGDGGRLLLTIQGMENPVQGKTQFIGLNLWNKNPQAVDIAERELTSIIHVTLGATQGRYAIQSTEELHNIPFYVLAKTGKGENGEPRTEIRGYKDANGNEPGKTGAGQVPQPAAPISQPPGQVQQPPGQPGWGAPQGQPNPPQGQPAAQPQPAAAPSWQPPQGQPAQQQPPAPGQGWQPPQGQPQPAAAPSWQR